MPIDNAIALASFDEAFRPRIVPSEGSKRRLLIVDDDVGPRQALNIVFKDAYEVVLAEDGKEAIDLARELSIDVAVVDIRMPGMSGIELLDRLKSLDPSIEVIILTAYEAVDTARQALRLGACEYVTKPFDLKVMREAVSKAMERHCLSEEIRANGKKLLELQAEIQNQRLREEIAKARGEIYASIVHDINGPLTIISGFIEAINQRIGNSLRIEGENLMVIKDRLARITRQVNNCIDISRRYLSFLRQQSAAKLQVKLNQLLTDLEELVRAHPSLGNNELIIHRVPEDFVLNVNGTDLIQVILNLTINALQATGDAHRVEIQARKLAQPIDAASCRDGANDRYLMMEQLGSGSLLAFEIRDTGPGIPPDVMGKLFVPYFSTKGEGKGTGLGLCIVQRLVKQSGGAIHLHSKAGEGTRFTVYMPMV